MYQVTSVKHIGYRYLLKHSAAPKIQHRLRYSRQSTVRATKKQYHRWITILSRADSNDVALLSDNISKKRLNKNLVEHVFLEADNHTAHHRPTKNCVLQEGRVIFHDLEGLVVIRQNSVPDPVAVDIVGRDSPQLPRDEDSGGVDWLRLVNDPQ